MPTSITAHRSHLGVVGTRSVSPLAQPSRPRRTLGSLAADDDGAATAEYAIATLAAVGFAGLLVVILRSDQVRAMLTDLIERALTVAG